MTFYWVLKDGQVQMRTCNKEEAILYIRTMQKYETHYLLKAEFEIITGTAYEVVPYEKGVTK